MSLNSCDAFKVGFLSRCIEDKLTPEQISYSVKLAYDLLEKQADGILSSLFNTGKDLVGGTAHYSLPALAAAPWLLGASGGYGLAKLTDIDESDVKDIKNKEVIDEYNRQTENLKRRKAVQEFFKSRQLPQRSFR